MNSRWRLVVLGGLFTLVTACGGTGDGGDGVASISDSNAPKSSATPAADDGKSDIDKMRDYAKCMRENGVDMADPDPSGGGGGGISVGSEAEKDKVDKANAKCKHLMPNGGEPEKPTAEDLDRARQMAKCLREHGIEIKEPTMDEPGISVDAGNGGNDPDELDKAMKACAPADAKTESRSSKKGDK
jgi:hypothetical protein